MNLSYITWGKKFEAHQRRVVNTKFPKTLSLVGKNLTNGLISYIIFVNQRVIRGASF